MDLFTYLLSKKDKNSLVHKGDLFSYLLGKKETNLFYIEADDVTNTYVGVTLTSTHTGYIIKGDCTYTITIGITSRYITLPDGKYVFKLKNTSAAKISLLRTNYTSISSIAIGSKEATFTLSAQTNVMLGLEFVNGVSYDEENEIMVYATK